MNNIIQFKSIKRVIPKEGYFIFLANDNLYATNGSDVVTWDDGQFIGPLETVFALIPGWINFFRSSLDNVKNKELKRNSPMVNPTKSRAVKVNIFYNKNNNLIEANPEYLVITKK
ncbi:hypothetical protein [Spiroplasma endosymbiont of Panorpa germanica]|uniref:hypothetical protein n=1 Tax=Spiroplasma endosymbiont of Panorpa germanica TaxID=3066314 RepID=UPI0030CE34FF